MSAAPRIASLKSLSSRGFHRLVYREWGPAEAARTLVCVHGLTRNGRDFDRLAGVLADEGWRVVCPDVAGRGDSDRLADPADYGLPQYQVDMTALIARLGVERVDWLGTSMGGLIGMLLAAQPGTPIRRLVLNDVGPFIPAAALARIAGYLGEAARWPDLAAAEADFRQAYAGFGPLSDAEWRDLTARSLRALPAGGYAAAYDPAIAAPLAQAPPQDVDLWAVWEAIAVPTLVLRGAESDLLLAETAQAMTRRGPRAALVELAGRGHAPALLHAEEIAPIRDWLAAGA